MALLNRVLAHRVRRRISPQRQVAHAVLRAVVRERDAEIVGQRRVQVGKAYKTVARRARGNGVWPADQAGDSMAALVDVRLMAAEDIAGIVAAGAKLLEIGHGRAAVVGRQHEDRVFIQTLFNQLISNLSDHVVAHQNEVAVFIRAGAPLKFLRREDGRVRRGQREIQEERARPRSPRR